VQAGRAACAGTPRVVEAGVLWCGLNLKALARAFWRTKRRAMGGMFDCLSIFRLVLWSFSVVLGDDARPVFRAKGNLVCRLRAFQSSGGDNFLWTSYQTDTRSPGCIFTYSSSTRGRRQHLTGSWQDAEPPAPPPPPPNLVLFGVCGEREICGRTRRWVSWS